MKSIRAPNVSMKTIAQCGAIIVTAVTMAILYYGLKELAQEAGYTPWQALLFPFPIDGLVLVAYISAYSFTKKSYRVYAWSVVIFGALLSATGQFLHTQSLVGTVVRGVPAASDGRLHTVQWWASLLAIAPALASPLALHIAVSLTRMNEPKPPKQTPAPTANPKNPPLVRPLTVRDGWPVEIEEEIKKVIAGEMTKTDLARKVVQEKIRTSSPDLSNARKLITQWIKNYQGE